jgi:deazaflavin-dependent oxidoreductase (nitroreductase family)
MQSGYGGVMRLPDQLARFNRHVTNPIQRMWAGKLPGFGIIEHVGRRSGKVYRTPVNTYRIPDGFAVFLVYGPDRDWVRNLNAAGRGRLVHRGRTYDVTDPTVLLAAAARTHLSKFPAALLRLLNVEYVLRLETK